MSHEEHGCDGFVRGQQGHASDPVSRSQPGHPTPASQNPYKIGEPIGGGTIRRPEIHHDLRNFDTPSGVPVTGQALINLQIACGANPDPFRTNFPGVGSVQGLREQASSTYHALQISARQKHWRTDS